MLYHNLRFGGQHVADCNGYGNGVLAARNSHSSATVFIPSRAAVKKRINRYLIFALRLTNINLH